MFSIDNINLRRKGLIIIAIPCLFQLVMFAVMAMVNRDRQAAELWAIHTKEVIVSAESTFSDVVMAHHEWRGFVISGEQIFEESFYVYRKKIAQGFADLSKLLSDNSEQAARIKLMEDSVQKFMDVLQINIERLKTGSQDEVVKKIKSLTGKKILDELRNDLNIFLATEEKFDKKRRDELLAASDKALDALLFGALAAVLLGIIIERVFSKSISRRFAELQNKVAGFAAKEITSAPMSGSDEISKLDQSFHDLAMELNHKNLENEMFVYSVSHDLRSPLVNLQGFSDELRYSAEKLQEVLSSDHSERDKMEAARDIINKDMEVALKYIKNAVSRLATIIDALLKLSRAGRVQYDLQTLDMNNLVKIIVDSMGAELNAKHIEVNLKPLPQAFGDKGAIEGIFSNLIANAVKYMSTERKGVIEIGSLEDSSDNERVTYYVRDNGLGIKKEFQDKLFKPFQRFHAKIAPGEGIGLALVRRSVERHLGKIWFESDENKGTTFYVKLPVSGQHSGLIQQKSVDLGIEDSLSAEKGI